MGKVYACDQWNYEAKRKSTLKSNQKVVYTGNIVKCDKHKRDFQSTSTVNLNDHKVVTHSNHPLSYKFEKCSFRAVNGQLVGSMLKEFIFRQLQVSKDSKEINIGITCYIKWGR